MNFLKSLLIVALLSTSAFFAASSAAWAQEQKNPSVYSSYPALLILSEEMANNAEPFVVANGANITVILQENVTTGYSWNYTGTPSNALILLSASTSDQTDQGEMGGLLGASKTVAWNFKALQEGRACLSFILSRPWNSGATPANSLSFAIDVKN